MAITARTVTLVLALWSAFFSLSLRAQTVAQTAAIAMPNHFSAVVAERVLRDGGNAVDAAIAAAFVLAVTYPEAGNIGGGGFATLYLDGRAHFIDFRETAPASGSRDMFLDEAGDFRQREALVGARAAGVPGTIAGLYAMHQRFASQPWEALLAPSIQLANEGFVVHDDLARLGRESSKFFNGETNYDQHFGRLREGVRFRQPDLGATLARLAQDPQDFYHGETARLLVAQIERSGGLITADDLSNYRSQWRDPLVRQWRDLTFITPPPPSSGGVALLQLLAMRDVRDDLFVGVAHNSPEYIHLLAELEKRVFADRARYLGDPDFVQVPVAKLLDGGYIERRASSVRPDLISSPETVQPGLESTDTTHFSILDAQGNAVSLTYTLNWEFGCGVVVEGAGFVLNNQMDDFSAKPGIPNYFGVVGSDANAIAAGKRMLSSMTPVIALRDNTVALVVGTPGGSTIITSVLQVVLNLYDFAMPADSAASALRFHHQLPDATVIRHDPVPIPHTTRAGLTALGYSVESNGWALGDIQLIVSDQTGIQAAADPRGRGVARLVAHDAELATPTSEARDNSE